MILSIVYRRGPDEVKFVMIDPKMLELPVYEEIPHMLLPIITDPNRANTALQIMVEEMERRYRLMSHANARDIRSYNERASDGEKMPYIVVFIDELADLMLVAPRDIQNSITRLAQMARAAGIHLVVATQRPSTDVITGLIKANFTARISFMVKTKVDSKVILDIPGAEKLLGKGDMLFLPQGTSTRIRVHGSYVSDAEVKKVVAYLKEKYRCEYDAEMMKAIESADERLAPVRGFEEAKRDPYYNEALKVAAEMGFISISYIQQRLGIGYNRAARIVRQMEMEGLVGPPRRDGRREVYISKLENMLKLEEKK